MTTRIILSLVAVATALAAFADLVDDGAKRKAEPKLAVAAAAVAAERRLAMTAKDIAELAPHIMEAVKIRARAAAREAKHVEELRKKGIAEVPASVGERHVVDIAGVAEMFGIKQIAFDDFGQVYIDRRFVNDEEMKTVEAIEKWFKKRFPDEVRPHRPPGTDVVAAEVPVFRGFEDARYQVHDELIVKLVKEFNANKAAACGGSAEQAAKIADLTPALVKAHMIEESGGNGTRSKAAWDVDPLQVNVPGDWGEEKTLVGLKKPSKRNEGTAEDNVRAAIKYLSRKGFSASAKPASLRPNGFFDGWLKALQRYNGRRDRTDTDRYYSDEYADKIVRRAKNPDLFVPIEIKLK